MDLEAKLGDSDRRTTFVVRKYQREYTNLQSDCYDAQGQYRSAKQENLELTKKLSEANSHNQDIAAELASMRAKLDEAYKAAESTKADALAKNVRLSELEKSLKSLQSQYDSARDELKALEAAKNEEGTN